MRMGWLGAALSVAVCAVAWAAAEPTRHDKFGLEVTFPEKWIVGSGEEPLLLVSRSMDKATLANCVATGERIAATRSLTQDQINQGLSTPFGEDFWRQVYEQSGLTAEVKSQGSRAHVSGVMIQEAFFDLSKSGGAADAKMSVQQAIFVRPGYTVTLACSARAAAYAKQKATLSAIVDSVRFVPPSSDLAATADGAQIAIKAGFSSPDAARAAGDASRAGAALLDLTK